MALHAAPIPLTSLLSSQRGGVGETWWGRKFLEVVMKSNDYIRLNAGKSYARNGQVQWIEASPCSVEAKVSGSYVYAVRIRFTPLPEESWKKMLSIISDEASFAARLMAGSFPEAMERRLSKQDLSLFPRVDPKSKGCNCPDKGSPCKHEAAIYFLLAENIDKDPFLLFLLHGKTKEDVLSGLREARVAESVPTDNLEVSVVPSGSSGSYYRMGAALPDVGNIPCQISDDKVLKKNLYDQLGKCPVPLGDANLGALIAELYPRAAGLAARFSRDMNRSSESDSS